MYPWNTRDQNVPNTTISFFWRPSGTAPQMVSLEYRQQIISASIQSAMKRSVSGRKIVRNERESCE